MDGGDNMELLKKIVGYFSLMPTPPPPPPPPPPAPELTPEPEPEPVPDPIDPIAAEKEAATQANTPWVKIVSLELDPTHPGMGSFELEYNQLFVLHLIKNGYAGKSDEQIVDQWFTDVARNIVLEMYEQEIADPLNRVQRRTIGNGRTEVG